MAGTGTWTSQVRWWCECRGRALRGTEATKAPAGTPRGSACVLNALVVATQPGTGRYRPALSRYPGVRGRGPDEDATLCIEYRTLSTEKRAAVMHHAGFGVEPELIAARCVPAWEEALRLGRLVSHPSADGVEFSRSETVLRPSGASLNPIPNSADAFRVSAAPPAVMLGLDGRAEPLYPLLNPQPQERPADDHETIYLYDGHYGIRELCDICPAGQLQRCSSAFKRPSPPVAAEMAAVLGGSLVEVNERAVFVSGLSEASRYLIQHTLGYQVHDTTKPHHHGRHGRADIGWTARERSEVMA